MIILKVNVKSIVNMDVVGSFLGVAGKTMEVIVQVVVFKLIIVIVLRRAFY